MSKRLSNNQFFQILKKFNEWIEGGNVITITESNKKYYATQDAQYRNRIETKDDLLDYFIIEFNL